MSRADLDALEAAARAATPGPWEATRQTDDECSFIGYFIEAVDRTISDDGTAPGHADALFIAVANPDVVLDLIQRLRVAEAAISAQAPVQGDTEMRRAVCEMVRLLEAKEWPVAIISEDPDAQALEVEIACLVSAQAPVQGGPVAWLDVAAERKRQIEVEGWSTERDDGYRNYELGRAAATYALIGSSSNLCRDVIDGHGVAAVADSVKVFWPWTKYWLKPKSRRSDLVKAGALILAEIERIDRAAIDAARKAATR